MAGLNIGWQLPYLFKVLTRISVFYYLLQNGTRVCIVDFQFRTEGQRPYY
jgi:hypothetical protein